MTIRPSLSVAVFETESRLKGSRSRLMKKWTQRRTMYEVLSSKYFEWHALPPNPCQLIRRFPSQLHQQIPYVDSDDPASTRRTNSPRQIISGAQHHPLDDARRRNVRVKQRISHTYQARLMNRHGQRKQVGRHRGGADDDEEEEITTRTSSVGVGSTDESPFPPGSPQIVFDTHSMVGNQYRYFGV